MSEAFKHLEGEALAEKIRRAKAHFASAYMNTGCEEDEATGTADATYEHLLRSGLHPETAADNLYYEATRYEDM